MKTLGLTSRAKKNVHGWSKKNTEKDEVASVVPQKRSERKRTSTEAKRMAIMSDEIMPLPCVVCSDVTERFFVGEWQPKIEKKDKKDKSKKNKKDVKYSSEYLEVDIPKKQYWLKCVVCNQVELFEEWRIQINKRARSLESIKIEESVSYESNAVYAIGDVIFHKVFDKVGIVRSKEITASGLSMINVEFKDIGMKSLLENLKNESSKNDNKKRGKPSIKLKIIKNRSQKRL